MHRALRLGDVRVVGLVRASHKRRDVGAVAARFLFLLACCGYCQRERDEEGSHLAAVARRQGFVWWLLLAVFCRCCTCRIACHQQIPTRDSAFAAQGVALG